MIALLLAVLLAQQPKADADPGEAPVIRLALPPTKPPPRALRSPLLPEVRDTTPGNAAPLYYRVFSPEWYHFDKPPDAAEFLKMSLEELRKVPEAKLPAGLLSKNLDEVDRAARREYCDWDLTRRHREEGLMMLVPEFTSFRSVGNVLALRARLEIIDGKLDRAHHTIQTGVAMGRHVAEGPTLIQGLVGIAICQIMLERVEELIQLPQSSNLYWSLTDLPRPLIDMRKNFQAERLTTDRSFPGVRDLTNDPAHARVLGSEQVEAMLDKFGNELSVVFDVLHGIPPDSSQRKIQMSLKLAAGLGHVHARKELISRGFAADKVEKMPPAQPSLMLALLEYDRLLDELVKWHNIPYPEASRGIEAAQREQDRVKNERHDSTLGFAGPQKVMPLATLLLPAVNKVRLAQEQLDRKVAALRTIEAIRLHAAANQGKLPARLEDVKLVPVPIDPMTGKPFEYKAEGSRATLTSPPPIGEKPSAANTLKYELTLKP